MIAARLPVFRLRPPALFVLLVAPALAATTVEPAPDALRAAWEKAAAGLANDAHAAFAALPDREARLGEALALLQRQPKTDSNLDRAATLLGELADRAPADDITLSARYYLARLAHVHRPVPDLVAARRHYARLVEEHPEHLLAERALVKLALLDLYAPETETSARVAALDAYAARVRGLRDPGARRDLAVLLADTALRFRFADAETRALDLLLVADAAGFARANERAAGWVRIGELARETGRADLARAYYQKFLAAFPRDNRFLMIEQNLAALPAPAPAPAVATRVTEAAR